MLEVEAIVPISKKIQDSKGAINTYKDTLYNGRKVTWRRLIIAPNDVERKTTVFGGNERVKDLLNEKSLDDIISTLSEYGPDKAAQGRLIDGIAEIADGSRRNASSILKSTPFTIDVTDLTDEEMLHLSFTGNIYRLPSDYEKGIRYTNLINKFGLNPSSLETFLAEKGEKVSRRNINRCVTTATLPRSLILLFKVPNDLTALSGESIAKAWTGRFDDLSELCNDFDVIEGEKPKNIIKDIIAVAKNPNALTENSPTKSDSSNVLAKGAYLKTD